MPYADASCQLPRARTGDSRQKSPTRGGIPSQNTSTRATLSATEQNIETTPSRRSGPRKWLRSVEWLIAAGLHPKANSTTLHVARDLAARMDYDTGHARYCMEETAARLGVDKSTVKRHIAVLRELGSLAWAVHGTKANIRSKLGLGGYAATATIYAATIPAAYDNAMGHTLIGDGYEASIVIDQRGQTLPTAPSDRTPQPVDNPPVDNPGSGSCAPPSLTLDKEEGQVQLVGGFNYTPRKRASRQTESPTPHQTEKRSSKKGSTGRSPLQVAKDIRIARRVRALVNWTQPEGLRRLAYVLRPFIDRSLDGDQIADELHGLSLRWRPKQPANYIRTVLAGQATVDARLAADEERRNSSTWRHTAADAESLRGLFFPSEPERERTDDDRMRARLDWSIWPEVAAHYADDPDDAIDLYGDALIGFAIRKDCQSKDRQEAWA